MFRDVSNIGEGVCEKTDGNLFNKRQDITETWWKLLYEEKLYEILPLLLFFSVSDWNTPEHKRFFVP